LRAHESSARLNLISNNPAFPDKRKKSPLFWLIFGCGGVLLLCIVGVFCIFAFFGRHLDNEGAKVPEYIAQLKAMHVPTEPHDLDVKPPIPDSQNVAPIYKQIQSEMEKIKGDPSMEELAAGLERYAGTRPELGDERLAREAIQKFKNILDLASQLR